MQKYDVNVVKIKEKADDFMRLSCDLNDLLSGVFKEFEDLSIKKVWVGDSATKFIKNAKIDYEQYVKLKDTIYEEGKMLLKYADEIEKKLNPYKDNIVSVHYNPFGMKNNTFVKLDELISKTSNAVNYGNNLHIPSGFSKKNELYTILDGISEIDRSNKNVKNELLQFGQIVEKLNNDFIKDIKGAFFYDVIDRNATIF